MRTQTLSGLKIGDDAEAPSSSGQPAGDQKEGGGGKATKAMKRREKAQREEVCLCVCALQVVYSRLVNLRICSFH
jgi:hypothetical protein